MKERRVEVEKREKWAQKLRNELATSHTVSSEALEQKNSEL